MPGVLSRAISGRAAEADVPDVVRDTWPPFEGDLPDVQGEVYLLNGCLMRTMFPSVHEATRRVLRRAGFEAREVSGCCGALHAHCGLADEARSRGEGLARGMPDDLPIIVNSAGCGSHMKDRGDARVKDVSEFLVSVGFDEVVRKAPGLEMTATYHDACHLAHGQKLVLPPRQLLEAVPGLTLVPLKESDLCCGSGGIYNLTQPEMARQLLNRKWANIEATEAEVVILGNPGCHAWVAQAARESGGRVRVMHTVEVLEAAFSGVPR
jgi:glycolate oxidase iron-sulfur subunit